MKYLKKICAIASITSIFLPPVDSYAMGDQDHDGTSAAASSSSAVLARGPGADADAGTSALQRPLMSTSGRADSDVESGVEQVDSRCWPCKKGPRTTLERMRRPKVLPKGAQVESMPEEELKQKVGSFIHDGMVHDFRRAHALSENSFRYTRFAGLSAAAKVITGLLGVLQATNFGLPDSVRLDAPYIALSLGLASTLAVSLDGAWFSRSAAAYDEAPQKYDNFLNELTDKFINDADLKTVNRKIEIRQLIEKALKERAGLDKK